MAITYFGSAANPADSGTQAGPTVSVTPPGSMVTGDLVCLVAGYKNGGVTFAMSNTGGQSWTAETQGGGATSGVRIRLFWCRFNGTWSADPSVTITSGTLAMSLQMHVFRPTTGTNTWSVQNAVAVSDNPAGSTCPTNGIILASGDLGFAAMISNDDNTYTNSSTGWTTAGTVQYRNLQGNDISMGAQYRLTSGTTNAQWTQATLGSDTYGNLIIGFRETSVGQSISADSGTFNLTGTAATLTAQRKVAADSGTFSLAGTDAALSKGSRLSADAGTFNLTGQDAGLRAQRYLSASAGAFVWTGIDATLTKSTLNHYSLTADSGTFIHTGQAANLLKGFYLSADAGGYSWTGNDTTLTAQRKIVADSGTYNYAGTDVSLTAQRKLIADSSSYILTGTAADLSKSSAYELDATAGSFVLTGSDASLLVHRLIPLSSGSFIFTGQDATLTKQSTNHYSLSAEAGAFNFEVTDISILRTYLISLEPGVFTITGQGATLGGAEYFIEGKSVFPVSISGISRIREGLSGKSKINSDITAKSIINE